MMDTRTRLLEAYLELCKDLSPEGVTVERIAKQAGVGFGTVRYNFAVGEASIQSSAVLHVVNSGVNFIRQRLEEARTRETEGPLAEYIRANFAWMKALPTHASYLVYYYSLSAMKQDLPIRSGDFMQRARERVRALYLEGVGGGYYPPVKDADAMAFEIHAAVLGACLAGVTDSSAATFRMQCDVAIRAVHAIISANAAAMTLRTERAGGKKRSRSLREKRLRTDVKG